MPTGLTIIKRFTYRGDPNEEFSNHYHLTGDVPEDAAAWRTLFNEVAAHEKICYPAHVKITAGYGYDSDDPHAHAVWSVDLNIAPNAEIPGTMLADGASSLLPGDAALWCRWGLDRMNSKGKRVYLRKYFHGCYHSSTSQDVPDLVQQNNIAQFAFDMQSGLPSGVKIRDTKGATIINHAAAPFITTRTLKRRGKRPT